MTAVFPDPSWVLEQYEALRREAIALGSPVDRGLGLSLFLTRGMSAWITALTALMPCSPLPARISDSDPPQLERLPELAPGTRSDLAVMLADMVLACYVEVSA